MRRRAFTAAAAALAVGVLVALLVGTGLGWWSESTPEGSVVGAPLSVSTSLTPASSFFGDPLVARVTVSLDSKRVQSGSLTVQPEFAPYIATGRAVVTRRSSGPEGLVVFAYTIQCETDGCLPRSGPITLKLPPVSVSAVSGGKRLVARAAWAPVVVSSRLQPADLRASKPPFRHAASAPAPVFGVAPGALADGLTAAAGLLGLVALLLFGREVTVQVAHRRASFRLSRLQSALGLVRQSAGRESAADRRKALELLAEVLAGEGRDALADSAGSVAWDEPDPSPDRILELADEVEALPSPEAR